MTKNYPVHAYSNQRAWKTQKRKQLKALEKAFDEFRFGCAYLPCYTQIQTAGNELQIIRGMLCERNWGR